MTHIKKFILFLNNKYGHRELNFYGKRLKDATTVAVDGGIRFFLNSKMRPDILIGDFDSSPRLSQEYLSRIEVIAFPPAKDKTDSQLALELALERGADRIELCGAISSTEIDHTLGNILLLELVNKFNRDSKRTASARLIDPFAEVVLVENSGVQLEAEKGDFLSIIPFSANPQVKLTGLEYSSPARPLRIGDTLSLRNQFIGRRASIEVKGKAVIAVIRRKGK